MLPIPAISRKSTKSGPSQACPSWAGSSTHLGKLILVWEQDGENSTSTEKILYFEGIDIRIMGWLIVVDHQIDGVCRGREEEQFEGRVPRRVRKGPEDI